MKFSKADPCPDHLLDPRWTSENGVWEIGVHPVMFGKRVRAGKVKSPFCPVDLCAGSDDNVLKELAVMVMYILESLPENANEADVGRLFPICRIKPVNNDPCWEGMRRLALERRLLSQAYADPT